jgi:hypothetical protein
MSLVVCDITPNEIVFLADSAHPTENMKPEEWPNDAKKVFLSPDQRVGIGIAGSLPFPWGGTCSQPEGWIENILQAELPVALSSPGGVVNVLKQRIEALRGLPFGNGGIMMVAGFAAGTPEVYDLLVRSKSEHDHDLQVQVRRPNENPLFYGCLASWDEVLTRSGRSGKPVPPAGKKRSRFLKRIMQSAIRALVAQSDHRVAPPVVVARIGNTV